MASSLLKDPFTVLPDELSVRVLSYLGREDLLRCVLLNRQWRSLALDKACWKWGSVDGVFKTYDQFVRKAGEFLANTATNRFAVMKCIFPNGYTIQFSFIDIVPKYFQQYFCLEGVTSCNNLEWNSNTGLETNGLTNGLMIHELFREKNLRVHVIERWPLSATRPIKSAFFDIRKIFEGKEENRSSSYSKYLTAAVAALAVGVFFTMGVADVF